MNALSALPRLPDVRLFVYVDGPDSVLIEPQGQVGRFVQLVRGEPALAQYVEWDSSWLAFRCSARGRAVFTSWLHQHGYRLERRPARSCRCR